MMTVPQIMSRVRLHQREGFNVPFEMTKTIIDEVRRLQDEEGINESEAIDIVSDLERKSIHKRMTKQYLEEELANRHNSDLNWLTKTKPRAL